MFILISQKMFERQSALTADALPRYLANDISDIATKLPILKFFFPQNILQ